MHTAETLSPSVWWQAVMALYSSRWSLQSLLQRSLQWLLSSNLLTHTHTHKLMHACMHKKFKENGHLKYQQHLPSKRKQPSQHRHIINMLTQAFLNDIASLNLIYEVILQFFAHVKDSKIDHKLVQYLLCDGEPNDWVSLKNVPCHYCRVPLQCMDGHIERSR